MLFFKEKKVAERLDRLDESVRSSFQRVREDNSTLFEWINYLCSQNTALQRTISSLKAQLDNIPNSPEAIKEIVDRYYSFESVLARIRQIETKMDSIIAAKHRVDSLESSQKVALAGQQDIAERLKELTAQVRTAERIKQLPQQPQQARAEEFHAAPAVPSSSAVSNLREKLVRRIARNSKEFIKNNMLAIIRKYGKISGMELREMIVEEQGLCSKSSFYRLLEELESEEKLNFMTAGKEKVYLASAVRKLH